MPSALVKFITGQAFEEMAASVVVGDTIEAIMQEARNCHKQPSPQKDRTYISLRDRLSCLVQRAEWDRTIRQLCDELDY